MNLKKEIIVFKDKDGFFKAVIYENKVVEMNEKFLHDALRIANFLYPEFNISEKVNNGEIVVKVTENEILKNLKATSDKITVNNFTFYPENINKCKRDIETGRQIKLIHANYRVGETLFATTDTGKTRSNQEDSVIILEHPKNPNFKIIAVSDGVGGSIDGELASNHIVKKLAHWFEQTDPYFHNDVKGLEEPLSRLLKHILDDLDANIKAEATLASAIIGNKKTLITTIGDSRVYSEKDGVLTQETRDDSVVQAMLDNGEIPHKNIMRFHEMSNQITQAISRVFIQYEPNYKIINNESYDKIFAMTDGITDSLSEDDMGRIINMSQNEQITKNLVMSANDSDTFLIEEIEKMEEKEKRKVVKQIRNDPNLYYDRLLGGEDNLTVAAHIKK